MVLSDIKRILNKLFQKGMKLCLKIGVSSVE